MEPKFQTSFIPKKPLGTSQGSAIEKIQNTNVFTIAATVIFVVTILISVGLFFYKNIVTNQIAQDQKSITDARATFEPDKIQQLIDANTRIVSIKNLLEKHAIVSRVLTLMQDLTMKKMRFTKLDYQIKDNVPIVTIAGEVQTYNALAEQQSAFLANEYIKTPIFSDLSLKDNGYVSVSFTAQIDPSFVSYKTAIGPTTLN